MKKTIIFLFLTTWSLCIFSQKEANIWYFGEHAGLDFNTGTPIALTDGEIDTDEGCAVISDYNGNLLFYTDGVTVYNRDHDIMLNGTGLLGSFTSTNSAIIVPKPDNNEQYYIFTTDAVFGTNGLRYSEVDMSLDNGLGGITSNKNIMLEPRVAEKLTAIKIPGQNAYWVVAHRWNSTEFLAFRVSNTGINPIPVTSPAGVFVTWPMVRSQGAMKISPDGKKLAVATQNFGVELFDFDSLNGTVSNANLLTEFDYWAYGVEFSPNSRILYVSSFEYGVKQYDLGAGSLTDIKNSSVTLTNDRGLWALQLATNGKIYVARGREFYLDAINFPNTLGVGCDYEQDAIYLEGRRSIFGLPPFIQTYFHVGNIVADNFCLGEQTDFSISSTEPINSILWDFGDGNTSTLENPNHVYASFGNYTVTATVSTASGTKTETGEITIYETPVANPATDFEVCNTEPNHEFDLSTKDTEILGSQSATDFNIAYFPTLVDAQNNTNAIPSLYTNTNTTETVYARISNINNSACFDITDFDLIVKEAPITIVISDLVSCGQFIAGEYVFDLAERDDEILNGQNASVFEVLYYPTLADAQSGSNASPKDFRTSASDPKIFYAIFNTSFPECRETGSFRLIGKKPIGGSEPVDYILCDDDNDGYAVFELSTRNDQIATGDTDQLNVDYYANLTDLTQRNNQLDETAFVNTEPYFQKIFVRVEYKDYPECYFRDDLVLRVYDSPLANTVEDWQICDSDADGLVQVYLSEKDDEIRGVQSLTDFSIDYYVSQADADLDQNPILGLFENTSNQQQIFYRIENATYAGCYLTGSFMLEVFTAPVASSTTPIVACATDETGIQTFDLSVKDYEILNGQDPNMFSVSYHHSQTDADNNQNSLPKQSYKNSTSQETLFARIQHKANENCYTTTNFSLTVNPLPQPDLEKTYVICPDSPELAIDGGNFESWSWRDASGIEIGSDRNISNLTLGDYSLTVTQTLNGLACEKTVAFEVVSSGAPEGFTYEMDGISDRITITVDAIGVGDFEYSVDGENFQDSNRLEVFPGEHTVYVRDKFLCRTITKDIIALGYQKFFTPNGDGIHENWHVIGASNYPNAILYIYDRYGKLLKQLSAESLGWDGLYQGNPLPASDYWFRYEYDGGKVFTGHFSLKR